VWQSRASHVSSFEATALAHAIAPHEKVPWPDFVLDTIGNHACRAVRDSCTLGRWADDVGAGANFGAGREVAGALASDHVSSSILESRKTWCYKET
jgi:hypothetical protein